MKYTVIKSKDQYLKYCDILHDLVFNEDNTEQKEEEIKLLTLLVKDWDRNHSLGPDLSPIELINSLIKDHELTQKNLAEIAGIGESYMSEILNYKKKMSNKVIRRLADHFKIRQEALNKEYTLKDKMTLSQ